MYNNKLYNNRNSGRFNTPGQFVPASETQQPFTRRQQQLQNQNQNQNQLQQQTQPQNQTQPQQQQKPKQKQQPQSNVQDTGLQNVDMEIKLEAQSEATAQLDGASKQDERPAWMKSKLPGVVKISNKERRRRQNEKLRRLLTPKNALMVLNEMMPNEQIANQFKVEAAQNQYFTKSSHSFCADLTLEGGSYKGYGENKLSARNAAAEQAIRDLIIKKMNKIVTSDGGSQNGEESVDEESLPMIQLASFALHKLFTEWEYDGHKVPQLRAPSSASESAATPMDTGAGGAAGAGGEAGAGGAAGAAGAAGEAGAAGAKPKKAKAAGKPRAVPANAAAMHPCMLLTYMRPHLEYRELAAAGDKPQNMMFTMGVDVDGATYIGKATNKKEARKNAAKSACLALFGTHFHDNACATTPLHA